MIFEPKFKKKVHIIFTVIAVFVIISMIAAYTPFWQ
jgi:hypothetical protein